MEHREKQEPRWLDLTLTVEQVVRLAVRWLPAMTLLSFLPFLVIWGLPAWPSWPGLASALLSIVKWILVGVLVYAVSAVVHELLHLAAMFAVARVPASSVRFGFRKAEGVLFVHTDRPMSAAAYRFVLILPAAVLGLVPVAAGTMWGTAWLVLYGYVMLISAAGDLAVLQLIRHLDARDRVRDHPSDVGCQVLVDPEE